MRPLLLFFLFTFFLYSTQFECPSKYTVVTDFSKSFKFEVTPDERQPIVCQYNFILHRYIIPTISISNVSLSSENSYRIRQNSGFATEQFTFAHNSKNFEDVTMKLNMTNTFFLNFEITENTEKDHFLMEIKFENVTPKATKAFKIDPTIGTVLDAQDLLVNGALEQTETYKYNMIRLVVFNESIDPQILKNIWVYGNGFEGTLYDIWTYNQFFSYLFKSFRFTIYNRNLLKVSGFSIVFYRTPRENYSPTTYSSSYDHSELVDGAVSAWNGSTKTEHFSKISTNLTYREITDPDLFVYQPTYIRDIRFKGKGKVDIYAGCISEFDGWSKRIATLTASNYADFENLILYGRCRTFRIIDAEVSWTKSPDPTPNTIATRGALMTYAYPYQTEPELHITWTIGHENVTDLLVQYEFAYVSAKVEISDNNGTLLGSFHNDSMYETIVIKSASQQQVRVNVSAETDGMLIRYHVLKASSAVFEWINVLFVLFVMIQ